MLGENIRWTLVHRQKSSSGSYWPTEHLIGHFSGDYISAITRCCRLKFLHALKIDPAPSPPPTGTPKKLIAKFKIWLKIQRVSLTSVLVGISSTKLSRRRGELCSTNKKVWSQILIDHKCAFSVSWCNSICHVVLGYGFRDHSPGGVVARGISNT